MRIENEAVLDKFRSSSICEFCLHPIGRGVRAEPHHVRAKGLGSGHRLDVSLNIVALCMYDHRKFHDGNIPRSALLQVVANRYFVEPDVIEEAINILIRLPKRCSTKRMRQELAHSCPEVVEMCAMAWCESGRYDWREGME